MDYYTRKRKKKKRWLPHFPNEGKLKLKVSPLEAIAIIKKTKENSNDKLNNNQKSK